MKTLFFFILLLAVQQLFSQSVYSPALNSKLNDGSEKDTYINVNIYFSSFYDINSLAIELDAKKALFDERVKSVTSLLKENSKISQNQFAPVLEDLLRLDAESVGEMQYFWGVNMLNMDVKKQYIYLISDFEGIRYIDLNSPRYKIPEIIENEASGDRIVNGAEPGLKAINAHKLWELGYTGRNILFLSMDTGVFPGHPAVEDGFAGNHFPLSQCWYGVRSAEPADNASSSHGTHTTGTSLGLDPATNDTIGVAFNAMWIASDPVASTDADLLAPDDFLNVFQWVLDPDGNPETTDDVPRVINNSWGYDYTLAMQFGACEMVEAEILVSIEIAGICSPFSAGNDGPVASSNGFPAMRAFNLVNPMSIGAVQSSNVIASFSSRGPTLCVEEEGSLRIKPEVSAPGVNIRSCSGINSYSNLQGTSMACPHVSGALLLLAEAFPMVSAYDLKYALYITAVDLGDAGEDNVYGNGMIDVFAAYNYLALSNTPVPPVVNDYDLTASLQSPLSEFLCPDQSSQNIQILIKNEGILSIDSFYVYIYINEVLVCDSLIEMTLENNEEFLFTSSAQQLADGVNFIHTVVKPYHVCAEFDRFNNAVNRKLYVLKQTEFPFQETFEELSDDLSDSDLFINNPDFKNTLVNMPWGTEDQYKSMGVDFLNYGTRLWEEDYASLPQMIVPDEDSLFLVFTYAYKNRLAQFYHDSLIVELSTDCGLNFTDILFIDGGLTLATVSGDAISTKFKPTDAADFDTVSVILDDYRGQEVVIRFRSMNDRGSVVYIDKIEILDLSVNYINHENAVDLLPLIYPNPAARTITIENPDSAQILRISDISGKLILSNTIQNGINQLNIESLSPGVYFVSFGNTSLVQKLIVE